MPEEIAQDAPVSIIDTDGNFSENWTDLLPEEVRGEEFFKGVTGLADLATQGLHAHKMTGRGKVVIPHEGDSAEVWEAYYKAGGRPETAGDYKVEVPKELGEIFTKERVAKIRELAHKLGASQAQLDAFLKYEMEEAMSVIEQEIADEKKAAEDQAEEVQRRFGGAVKERMHTAELALDQASTPALKIALLQKYKNDPDFIQFASEMGIKLVEHKALDVELTKQTPQEAIAKMDALRATPGYLSEDHATGILLSRDNPARYEAITQEISRLVKEAYPEAREPAFPY